MSRKDKDAIARRRAQGKIVNDPFIFSATERFGAIEIGDGSWRLTEERRTDGKWTFHRYVTEIETFPNLEDASAFAVEEATRRRKENKGKYTDWITMRYPAAFLQEIPRTYLPGKLPPDWSIRRVAVDDPMHGPLRMDQFYRETDGLRVSMRFSRLSDGKDWLAVNVSFEDETPDWETMSEVKILFIGAARWAFQVHPPRSQYVSYSATMLHWFVPLNGWNMPDLRPIM